MPWVTIDCHYLFPKFAASFLKVCNNRGVFIENNTSKAVPHLIDSLKAQGVSPNQVDYLMVTHAHLDHAGGTSLLASLCPEAVVLAHPKAARTLSNPDKIIEGAIRVYGEAKFTELYGHITPLDSHRIRVVSDGERIRWEDRSFLFFYTEGHASHHLCILDEKDQVVFTGDSFGLSYPGLQGKKQLHFPSTSPVDFDFALAQLSIDRIVQCGAQTAFLTHFGPVTELAQTALELKRHLEFHQSLIEEVQTKRISDEEVNRHILGRLEHYFEKELEKVGMENIQEAKELLKLDIELNAAGLAVSCLRQRKKNFK